MVLVVPGMRSARDVNRVAHTCAGTGASAGEAGFYLVTDDVAGLYADPMLRGAVPILPGEVRLGKNPRTGP